MHPEPPAAERIALVALKYAPALGGVERVVEQQAGMLAAAGHAVTVFTTPLNGGHTFVGLPAQETVSGITIRRFPVTRLPRVKYPLIRGMGQALHRAQPGLIHAHSFWYHNLVIAVRAAHRDKIPLVVQPHYDHKTSSFTSWYRRTFGPWLARAGTLVFVSRHEENLFRSAGLPVHHSYVLPHAVEPDEFAAAADPAALRTRLGLGDRPVLLTVGRVEPGKGVTTFLALARRLKAAGTDQIIVWCGPDLGAMQQLQAAIAGENLARHFVLTGPLPRAELLALYRTAHCYLHASRYEAFGIVLIEAMAAGLPVIAAAAGAVPEVVTDGVSGLLYPVDDNLRLAALVDRLDREQQLRAQLIAGGLAQVAARHTLAVYLRALQKIYHEVMQTRS